MREETIDPCPGSPPSRPAGARFLFYSHDGVGLGHTRRHVAVARALSQLAPRASILLATGSDIVSRLGLAPPVDVLKLPGLRKLANEQYASRRLRIPGPEIRALRSALLLAAIRAFQPKVVLVDKHPFGAKGEFEAGLEELRASGGSAVLGLRDILDEPARVLREWSGQRMQERISDCFERILVYGNRSVFDPVAEYAFPEAMAARTRFCGYVLNQDPRPAPAAPADGEEAVLPPRGRAGSRPRILATAGGGEDGFHLLETFILAAARAGWHGIAVAGPMNPAMGALERLAPRAKVRLHSFVPNLPRLFEKVDAVVCMGGYNTLVEAVSSGVPIVCVPRTEPRREQWIRARAFERLGLLTVLEPGRLDPDALRQAVEARLGSGREEVRRRGNLQLGFEGARRAAVELLTLASP